MTHTVFYRTAFGARPRTLPRPDRAYLRDWLPVWVKHDADLGNHDIAAELIMVARCIGLADDERWGAVLRSAQTGEGMVPVRGAGAARSSRAPPRRGAGPSSTTTTPPWWR